MQFTVVPKCRACNDRVGVRRIVYGTPATMPDVSRYVVAGTSATPQSPAWACVTCGWQVPAQVHVPLFDQLADAMEDIVDAVVDTVGDAVDQATDWVTPQAGTAVA
jgi:hypothetical protein